MKQFTQRLFSLLAVVVVMLSATVMPCSTGDKASVKYENSMEQESWDELGDRD